MSATSTLLFENFRWRLWLRPDGCLTTARFQGENGPWRFLDHYSLTLADAEALIQFLRDTSEEEIR